jgi:hypothetical protein
MLQLRGVPVVTSHSDPGELQWDEAELAVLWSTLVRCLNTLRLTAEIRLEHQSYFALLVSAARPVSGDSEISPGGGVGRRPAPCGCPSRGP